MNDTQTANTASITFVRYETLDSGYHAVITDDGEPIEYHWLAECTELPGCMTSGRTADEARDSLKELIPEFIALLREDGCHVPAPNEHLGKAVWDHSDAYYQEGTN